MLTALLAGGFVAGVLTTLLTIKILPVKVSFDFGASKTTSNIKAKLIRFHPKYCKKCGTVPCQDTFNHQYDS